MVVSLYLLLHAIIRLIFTDTLQVDDREQLFYAQSFEMGYDMPQPPLYSWIAFVFFKIFNVGLISLTIQKYLIIFITFCYIWLSSNLIFKNQKVRNIVFFSYLLMPSFMWHMHQGFTHTVLLGLGIAMSFYYFICLLKSPKVLYFFMLGLSFSIGFMGKYSFLIFLFLLITSVLISKNLRYAFLDRRFLITLTTFLIFIFPHSYWLSEHFNQIFVMASDRLNISSNDIISNKLLTLNELIFNIIGFVTPLIFVLFLSLKKGFLSSEKNKLIDTLDFRFLRNFHILILVFSFVFVLFANIGEVKVRWLHPLMMLFPFWIACEVNNKFKSNVFNLRRFSLFLIAFTILVLVVRVIQFSVAPSLGFYGRVNIPITDSIDKIPKKTIDQISSIKTNDYFLGNHLHSLFRDKEIVITGKYFNLDKRDIFKDCLWIWDNDGYDDLDINSYSQIKFKEVQKITKSIENKPYILSYAIEDKSFCHN